jgi:hypothetical protein
MSVCVCIYVWEKCEGEPGLDFLWPPLPFREASGLPLLRPPPNSIAALRTPRSHRTTHDEDKLANRKKPRGSARKSVTITERKLYEKNESTEREREREREREG